MKTFRVLSLMLLLLAVPSWLCAQRPVDGELQVNLNTVDAQLFPHLATNPSGEFVVTWIGAHADDAEATLYAARFNADGTPGTGQIVVTDQAFGQPQNSALAMMDDGSFVVVFPDADAGTLTARWYTPGGSPDGEDVVVTHNGSPDFAVSTDGDGGFVAVWEGSTASVFSRVFHPSHAAGPEVLVDATGKDPAVAVGPQGAFVVAWKNGSVVARRFTAAGAVSGRRFTVAPGAGNVAAPLRIAKDGTGNFLILWGDGPTIHGQRYASNATRLGNLLSFAANVAGGYDLAMGGKGNFVLAWAARDAGATGTNVLVQRYNPDGSPTGPQLRANIRAKGFQGFPDVGIGADGGFVVVWQSQPDTAVRDTDIFARQYELK